MQFLDVDSMLKHTELEYNRISDTCSALISEISDSFQSSLRSSVAAYRSAGKGNKTLGLAMAGLGMLNHYMQASERTMRLRSDLTTFKTRQTSDDCSSSTRRSTMSSSPRLTSICAMPQS